MAPAEILEAFQAQGFAIELVEADRLAVSPASALDDSQRELLRVNKAAMVELLREAHKTTTELLKAAMRACDLHKDSVAAREQMRADCLATPQHLRADLLAHFNTYSKAIK